MWLRNSAKLWTACEKKTRAYKKKLTKSQRKTFRSQMWLFRKRPEELTADQEHQLQDLFAAIPDLERVYHFRWGLTNIFDSPMTREAAADQFDEIRNPLDAADSDDQVLLEFFNTYDAHRDGILAYFDERKTSGVMEGIINKARVITKRCYGVKSIATLWSRLCLDINLKHLATATKSVKQIHALTNSIRTKIASYYT